VADLLELSFELEQLDPEAAEAACFDLGAGSVTFMDCHETPVLEPLPGELRLWPATRVCAMFERDLAPDLAQRLAAALGLAPGQIAVREVEDRIWEREWLKDFHARRFGRRLWVCPHHEEVLEPGAVIVQLDPGMAFGTGAHASTALCLEWLDGHLESHARVIDYGCGSGVLAVAALKLGAQFAACFDIDPQALIASRENAEANGVLAQLIMIAAADDLPSPVDLVLANILSEPLIQLAPRFASLVAAGGQVVLAGLMDDEAHSVTAAYDTWFDMGTFRRREGWTCLTGRRRKDPTISHEARGQQ
jgi:ribosomal protein L11 methyltransferase